MQRLAQTTYHMEHITEEIRVTKSRLIALLAEYQDYKTALGQFEKWLKRTEKSIERLKPISVSPEEVSNQSVQIKVWFILNIVIYRVA